MGPVVRFAPSPTGYLHIGNLRTALFNWVLAKGPEAGGAGTFILRFDDTDAERSRRDFADAILEDIAWIGLRPDRVVRQSDRFALYDAAAALLEREGVFYPCFETAEELGAERRRRSARGLPPVYGRGALRLSADERRAMEAAGRRPHWRFLLPNFKDDPFRPERTEATWADLVRGPQAVDLASLSDPVLKREDGTYLYTLTSVVDDGDLGVTRIVRGDDHVTNTGVQIALFRALGLAVPAFGHHNLLVTADGEGLSKRSGALSLRSLREEGLEPMAVASLAALVGLAGSVEALPSLDDLCRRVRLSDVSQSPSKFDPAEVERLNGDLLRGLGHEAVAARLELMGVPAAEGEAFWLAVRGNCVRLPDAAVWRDVVYGALPERPVLGEADLAFVRDAFGRLPPESWNAATWGAWTGALKAATGRKGRALFMPLRLALTGLDHGPELAALLPLIGRERALARRP